MRLLTAVDQLFLLIESRKKPMHVGGLFLFEKPEAADSDFVYQLVKQMQESDVPPSFPFNQVLEHLIFGKKTKTLMSSIIFIMLLCQVLVVFASC
ncbi:hypothetical protein Psyaliredsea_03720 [Psychrobacter alimentarius]